MGFYDEQIKKADREIEQLLSDIEKKKSRIAELRLFKKDCEAKRQRDDTYSNNLLQVLADGGIKSDEQRKEILLHLQEYISARNEQYSDEGISEQTEETNTETITNVDETTSTVSTGIYQNSYIHTKPNS